MRQLHLPQDPASDLCVAYWQPSNACRTPFAIKDHHAAADDVAPRFFPQSAKLELQPLRMHQVVCIHARQILAGRKLGDLIQPGSQSGVFAITYKLNPRVRDGPGNGGALVRRPVIDKHQLPIRDGLGENRLQRCPQEAGGIPDGQSDCDQRRQGSVSLASAASSIGKAHYGNEL